jgi:hypothetical protein
MCSDFREIAHSVVIDKTVWPFGAYCPIWTQTMALMKQLCGVQLRRPAPSVGMRAAPAEGTVREEKDVLLQETGGEQDSPYQCHATCGEM